MSAKLENKHNQESPNMDHLHGDQKSKNAQSQAMLAQANTPRKQENGFMPVCEPQIQSQNGFFRQISQQIGADPSLQRQVNESLLGQRQPQATFSSNQNSALKEPARSDPANVLDSLFGSQHLHSKNLERLLLQNEPNRASVYDQNLQSAFDQSNAHIRKSGGKDVQHTDINILKSSNSQKQSTQPQFQSTSKTIEVEDILEQLLAQQKTICAQDDQTMLGAEHQRPRNVYQHQRQGTFNINGSHDISKHTNNQNEKKNKRFLKKLSKQDKDGQGNAGEGIENLLGRFIQEQQQIPAYPEQKNDQKDKERRSPKKYSSSRNQIFASEMQQINANIMDPLHDRSTTLRNQRNLSHACLPAEKGMQEQQEQAILGRAPADPAHSNSNDLQLMKEGIQQHQLNMNSMLSRSSLFLNAIKGAGADEPQQQQLDGENQIDRVLNQMIDSKIQQEQEQQFRAHNFHIQQQQQAQQLSPDHPMNESAIHKQSSDQENITHLLDQLIQNISTNPKGEYNLETPTKQDNQMNVVPKQNQELDINMLQPYVNQQIDFIEKEISKITQSIHGYNDQQSFNTGQNVSQSRCNENQMVSDELDNELYKIRSQNQAGKEEKNEYKVKKQNQLLNEIKNVIDQHDSPLGTNTNQQCPHFKIYKKQQYNRKSIIDSIQMKDHIQVENSNREIIPVFRKLFATEKHEHVYGGQIDSFHRKTQQYLPMSDQMFDIRGDHQNKVRCFSEMVYPNPVMKLTRLPFQVVHYAKKNHDNQKSSSIGYQSPQIDHDIKFQSDKNEKEQNLSSSFVSNKNKIRFTTEKIPHFSEQQQKQSTTEKFQQFSEKKQKQSTTERFPQFSEKQQKQKVRRQQIIKIDNSVSQKQQILGKRKNHETIRKQGIISIDLNATNQSVAKGNTNQSNGETTEYALVSQVQNPEEQQYIVKEQDQKIQADRENLNTDEFFKNKTVQISPYVSQHLDSQSIKDSSFPSLDEKMEPQLPIIKQEKQADASPAAPAPTTNDRPRREIKKSKQYNCDYVIDFNEKDTIEESNKPRKIKQEGTFKKLSKITEGQDPFQFMYKHIMEPIILYDRLCVLREDKSEYEILLKAKDLKNLNTQRKEELLQQRVYIQSNTTIICDLDPKFERHIYQTSPSLSLSKEKSFNEPSSGGQNIKDTSSLESGEVKINENSEISPQNQDQQSQEQDGGNDSDAMSNKSFDQQEQQEFKKPMKKRRKKGSCFGISSRRHTSSQSKRRSYQSCLPSSLRDCSWLENTQNNILIMHKKNKQIQEQREKKKLEDLNKKLEEEKIIEEEKQENEEVEQKDYGERGLSALQEENINQTQNDEQKNQEDDEMENEQTSNKDEEEIQKDETQENKGLQIKIKEDEQFVYVCRDQIISLDQIEHKFLHHYYPNLDDMIQDFEILVTNTIKNRCQNVLSKIYLTNFLIFAQKIIKGGGDPTVWYQKFDESTKRQYYGIDNYKVMIPGEDDNKIKKENPIEDIVTNVQDVEDQGLIQKQLKVKERIEDIMKTKKTSKCNGTCCIQAQSELKQDLNHFQQLAQETCECIKTKTECGPECGCDPNKCRNRQMSMKQSLRLGIDVEEKVTWGMDLCTAVNFMTICPHDLPQKIKSQFVEKKLIYAIQQQNENGYDVLRALRYMMEADLTDEILSQKYTQQDKEIAGIVHDAIQNMPTKNTHHFRIHTKGVGIFCKRKEGISKNALVVEYLGEIYKPWLWFEKQDVIKQGQNAKKLPKDLPDFYNITFERHPDDPDGYNILTVDPILYGNYASRLSHSCSPNCQTVNKVRNGAYSIGMFTNQNIGYGEELCFDYCSYTESEKEFEEAVCLCGTALCKGRYLNLANDKKNLAIMKNYHTFIDRNYLIFKAIKHPNLTKEDRDRLNRNALKDSCLNGAPNWLQKWASLICEYLEFEEILYPTFFKDDYPGVRLEDIKLDANIQKVTQIQNIAITIDKVMHVLESMGTYDPPIRPLTYEERYRKIWIDNHCLRENVLNVLKKIEQPCAQVDSALLKLQIQQESEHNTSNTVCLFLNEKQLGRDNELKFKSKYNEVRQNLADVSDILRSVNSHTVAIPAFCDILMMYANTESYFSQSDSYKKCKSSNVTIRKCDVRHQANAVMDTSNQGKSAYMNAKEYDSQYIWGQLVGWFKQTVDKPNASLSADRRGTLSIPDVESFIVDKSKLVFIGDQNSTKNQTKKKNKRGVKDEEEIIINSKGSRSRPRKVEQQPQTCDNDSTNNDQEGRVDSANGGIVVNNNKPTFNQRIQITYPSKRYPDRQKFLKYWNESFSKQWDVCCAWSFQNKLKMYGSIQFESILQSDNLINHPKREDLADEQDSFEVKQMYEAIEQHQNIQGTVKQQQRKEITQNTAATDDAKRMESFTRYQTHIKHRLDYFNNVVQKLLKY